MLRPAFGEIDRRVVLSLANSARRGIRERGSSLRFGSSAKADLPPQAVLHPDEQDAQKKVIIRGFQLKARARQLLWHVKRVARCPASGSRR